MVQTLVQAAGRADHADAACWRGAGPAGDVPGVWGAGVRGESRGGASARGALPLLLDEDEDEDFEDDEGVFGDDDEGDDSEDFEEEDEDFLDDETEDDLDDDAEGDDEDDDEDDDF